MMIVQSLYCHFFLNYMDLKHLCSSQEEADTRLILHSLDSVQKVLQSCTFSHIIFHYRCRKQEAKNITETGSAWHLVSQELHHCPAFCKTL